MDQQCIAWEENLFQSTFIFHTRGAVRKMRNCRHHQQKKTNKWKVMSFAALTLFNLSIECENESFAFTASSNAA